MTAGRWTYRKAGVDIAAGNEAVRRLAPLAAATRRPGVLGGIGGFGGLFAAAAAPEAPRSGGLHRRRRHQAQDRLRPRPSRHRRHRPGGDVGQRHSRPGSRAALFSRLYRLRQAAPGPHRRPGQGDGRGLPPGRVRPARRRDRRDAGVLQARGVRPGRFRRGRGRARRAHRRQRHPPRRRAARPALERPAQQRLQPRARGRRGPLGQGRLAAHASRRRPEHRRGVPGADADLRQAGARPAQALPRRRHRAPDRRRLDREHPARAPARVRGRGRPGLLARAAAVRAARERRADRPRGDAAHLQPRHRVDPRRPPAGRRGLAARAAPPRRGLPRRRRDRQGRPPGALPRAPAGPPRVRTAR